MADLKFNGILKEITEQFPNIDLADFLQDNLNLPRFKAEELATRIRKQYLKSEPDKKEPNFCSHLFELMDESESAEAKSVYLVGSLSGKEFEHFILWLFGALGYEVDSEIRSFSFGFDFSAMKGGEKMAVLALKAPKHCRVTDSVILLAKDAQMFHGCEHTIILSTAHFTKQAVEAAGKLGIELWDSEALDKHVSVAQRSGDVVEAQVCFPDYKGSLLQTLLAFDESEDFILEPRAGSKYDLYLSNVKFPLLTFQAASNVVTKCIFRIKNSQPVSELDGLPLRGIDRSNTRFGPDDLAAYNSIIEYLEEFLE